MMIPAAGWAMRGEGDESNVLFRMDGMQNLKNPRMAIVYVVCRM
jgi:hypothetical protein